MKIALTFDDFPCSEIDLFPDMNIVTFDSILNVLKKYQLTGIYSFMTAIDAGNTISKQRFNTSCQQWVDAGHHLANHTYSHFSLSKITSDEFNQDIEKLDLILKRFEDKKNNCYFRYPFLSLSNDVSKYQRVQTYLHNNNYQVAQVTIDTKDYLWASQFGKILSSRDQKIPFELEESFLQFSSYGLQYSKMLSELVFNREIKFISLLHFKYFSAQMLEKLIQLYQQHGVEFISLDEAMQDPAYKIDPFDPLNDGSLFLERIAIRDNFSFDPEMLKIKQQMGQIIENMTANDAI